MLDVPWLKQLLDTLFVIFINYLYSSSPYEFIFLIQTYRVTFLKSPSFPAFRAGVGTRRLIPMKQCQFTSAIALLVQPEDVTQAVGNIPPPVSFNIQGIASVLIFSNDIPPPARCNEMAGLRCAWRYYFLAYSVSVKGRELLKIPLEK